METLKIGDLIEFKYSKNGKWRDGRIDRIEPETKYPYSVETYELIQPVYFENVWNNSGKDWREWDKKKWIMKWCFLKWFSKDYLRKKVGAKTLQ